MKQRRWLIRDSVIKILANPANRESHRLPLCAALGFSEAWIIKVVEANKANGPLTLYSSLITIMELLKIESFQGILEDADLLEGQK